MAFNPVFFFFFLFMFEWFFFRLADSVAVLHASMRVAHPGVDGRTVLRANHLYYVAYPAFHFCVMLERARTTVLAVRYEQEGQRLGIWMSSINVRAMNQKKDSTAAQIAIWRCISQLNISRILQWLISMGYMTFVIVSALADTELFGQPQGIIFLTSKYNNQPIFCISIFTLGLTIFTAFCGWHITVLNKRLRQNTSV